MNANSTGNCYLCGARLIKSAMKNHIIKSHGEDKGGQECYLMKIEGSFLKGYWLYIDVPKERALVDVDRFLRKIWLECCGHMSTFFYPGYIEIPMSRKLKNFVVGDEFLHHYDFGTTTETVITFIGNTTRRPQRGIVRLLARNAPPVFNCKACGNHAQYICKMYDGSSEDAFYCEECLEDHLDADMDFHLLPITNSPRMGECGYEGEYDVFTFDPTSFVRK
ncbi:MAG: hypothetical protein LBQ94_00500 [Treponema sp.]|jgi:hypothetical protein|nr:hypothetical protein [Treponema sp.]